LTLATVIAAIIWIDYVLALGSFIVDMRTCLKGEVEPWLPATIARTIASGLKDMIKELSMMAYIYAAITAAVASYLTFLTH